MVHFPVRCQFAMFDDFPTIPGCHGHGTQMRRPPAGALGGDAEGGWRHLTAVGAHLVTGCHWCCVRLQWLQPTNWDTRRIGDWITRLTKSYEAFATPENIIFFFSPVFFPPKWDAPTMKLQKEVVPVCMGIRPEESPTCSRRFWGGFGVPSTSQPC